MADVQLRDGAPGQASAKAARRRPPAPAACGCDRDFQGLRRPSGPPPAALPAPCGPPDAARHRRRPIVRGQRPGTDVGIGGHLNKTNGTARASAATAMPGRGCDGAGRPIRGGRAGPAAPSVAPRPDAPDHCPPRLRPRRCTAACADRPDARLRAWMGAAHARPAAPRRPARAVTPAAVRTPSAPRACDRARRAWTGCWTRGS